MANNPYVNKVVKEGTTLIDISSDTVTADKLLSGYTAHDASGASVTGSVTFSTIYTGTGNPSSSQGSNGDVYLKTVN